MIYLTEEISSQENMEAWFSQLSDPAFPLKKGTILEQLKPRFCLLQFCTTYCRICIPCPRLAVKSGRWFAWGYYCHTI